MPASFTRPMPPLHFEPAPPLSGGPCEARVYASGDGAFVIHIDFAGVRASVQTTRAGVEAMRDACNLALIHEDPGGPS